MSTMPVPVIVIEDISLKDTLDLPQSGGGFEFEQHDSFGNLVKDIYYEEDENGEGLKVSGKSVFDEYRKFLSGDGGGKWSELSGPAIIIADLGLEANLDLESKEGKDAELVCGDERAASITSWVNEWEGDPQQKEGLYLLGEALKNSEWHGVIYAATSIATAHEREAAQNKKGEVEELKPFIERFISTLELPPNVKVGISDVPINRLAKGNKVLNQAIRSFLEEFGDIEKRIWPETSSKADRGVESWFSPGHSRVPHNCPPLHKKEERERAEEAISSYLENLFGFEPPKAWFGEEQFKHLYKDLEALIGRNSTSHTGRGRNLTLGNLVILLAAACGKEHAGNWIKGISWTKAKSRQEILPSQNREQARDVVSALVKTKTGFFQRIKEHEEDGRSLIDKVRFTIDRLQIVIGFPYVDPTKDNRPSLREKVRALPSEDGGGTYTPYRNFWEASGVNKDGDIKRRCVLNWKSLSDEQTCFEIVSIQP